MTGLFTPALTSSGLPSSEQILSGLTRISQRATPLAVLWHLVLAAALLALAFGWRPSQRTAALLLALPLVSVSVLALLSHNPFNAAVFAAGAFALLALGSRVPTSAVERASSTITVWGLLLIEFGWLYPHFLGDAPALTYVYAAPLGLVPCPTLATVIGFSLLARGFEARAWSTILGGLGLFYGVFGVVRLGVAIDALLAIGALILLGLTWSRAEAAAGLRVRDRRA